MALSWIHYISLAKVSFSIFLNISHTWDYPDGLTCFHRKEMTLSAHLYVIADLWSFSCAKVRTADDCIKNHSYFAIPAWLFRQPSAFFLQKNGYSRKLTGNFLLLASYGGPSASHKKKAYSDNDVPMTVVIQNTFRVEQDKSTKEKRTTSSYETR